MNSTSAPINLTQYSSRWLKKDWNKDDIVVCYEVKMSRNIQHTDFAESASLDDRKRVMLTFKEYYDSHQRPHQFMNTRDMDHKELLVVVENRMCSAEFADMRPFSAISYDTSNGTSICINDSDHLRIRSVGKTVWEALKKAQGQETELVDSGIHFAYKKEFGFLTSHYDECGSGMRISAVVRLPALNLMAMVATVAMRAAVQEVKMGRAFGASGKYFCDMVQMHVDPPSIAHIGAYVKKLESVIAMAVEKEFDCRKMILSSEAPLNAIGLSWGAMTNTKSISYDMGGTALSHAVLAIKSGLTDIASPERMVNKLRDVVTAIMPGHLYMSNTNLLNMDLCRADLLRSLFRKKSEFKLR
jgi:protein arginine kinase